MFKKYSTPTQNARFTSSSKSKIIRKWRTYIASPLSSTARSAIGHTCDRKGPTRDLKNLCQKPNEAKVYFSEDTEKENDKPFLNRFTTRTGVRKKRHEKTERRSDPVNLLTNLSWSLWKRFRNVFFYSRPTSPGLSSRFLLVRATLRDRTAASVHDLMTFHDWTSFSLKWLPKLRQNGDETCWPALLCCGASSRQVVVALCMSMHRSRLVVVKKKKKKTYRKKKWGATKNSLCSKFPNEVLISLCQLCLCPRWISQKCSLPATIVMNTPEN